MLIYGKLSRAALSAMSYLAQVHDKGELVSSLTIAADRNLSKALIAKILTLLSNAGLVDGAPGPRGGYRLNKPPSEILLSEIVSQFETPSEDIGCPFGPGYCGNGPQCPLHDELSRLKGEIDLFLENTNLAVFDINDV